MPAPLKSVARPDRLQEPSNVSVPDRDKLHQGLAVLFAVHPAPLMARLAELEARDAAASAAGAPA